MKCGQDDPWQGSPTLIRAVGKRSLDLPKTDFARVLMRRMVVRTHRSSTFLKRVNYRDTLCGVFGSSSSESQKSNASFQASVIFIRKAVRTYMPCVTVFPCQRVRSCRPISSAHRCVSVVASWYVVKIKSKCG